MSYFNGVKQFLKKKAFARLAVSVYTALCLYCDRAKCLRRWRYRAAEQRGQRGQRDLTRLYWASWKSQTAASLLSSQQVNHHCLTYKENRCSFLLCLPSFSYTQC